MACSSYNLYSGGIEAGSQCSSEFKNPDMGMSSLGVPKRIKTDNGPAYTSQAKFCIQWGIEHTTGTPYNPQGQAIIEDSPVKKRSSFFIFFMTSFAFFCFWVLVEVFWWKGSNKSAWDADWGLCSLVMTLSCWGTR